MRVSPARGRMNGGQTYRSLSHRFVVRSNDGELARQAGDLITEFAEPVEDDGGASESVVYTLRATPAGGDEHEVGLFRGAEELASGADAGTAIDLLLWQITNDTVMLADGYLLVHAGAVVTPAGDAVLILGEAGSGKTTLVAALVQDGFGYLSDEAGAIELDTGVAHPWPRALGFTAGSRTLARFASLVAPAGAAADDAVPEKTHVKVDRIRPGAIAHAARVRHVIDHRFAAGAPTRAQPLSRATAVARIGSAAPRLRHEGARGLETLVEMMRGAEAHDVVTGDLNEAVSTLSGLVGR